MTLLAQDYLLKQITVLLIYPENQLGKEFWQKIYAQAQAKYGTTIDAAQVTGEMFTIRQTTPATNLSKILGVKFGVY